MLAPNASPFPRMTGAANDLGLGQKLQTEADAEAQRQRKRKKLLEDTNSPAATALLGGMGEGMRL